MQTRTCFTLNEDILTGIKLLALQRKKSMAELIRQALVEYLEKHNAEAILPKCAG